MEIGGLLEKLREEKPLVHHITNMVTMSECANVTLVAGGLPIMAHAPQEVAEMVSHAGALVLNIGTLTPAQVDAMVLAGRRANELGLPVVLDPVGAGATSLRSEAVKRLLKEIKISIIKGNEAEIAIMAGGAAEIKGVESINVSGDVVELAVSLARDTNAVVAVTGAVDRVTDGERMVEVANGNALMATVVGTGCMTASVMGCFAAVEKDTLKAAVAALVTFNVAAELAARNSDAPASFKSQLFDELYRLDEQTIRSRQNIKERMINQ
ncbi:hydroxyethylthiazole kinase [Dethiobacter alkaliphilus]|uniref:hydroxyethylthiazole kinase n=1 Tax=Dethiobacter alkaliphilus TaxID=427926 RepID=UPI002226D3F0|nr:hydroxyethylthiazole kinase [Dethiobacter alkaliphilus]MCW3490547.1 hydroxyethylthiazole kinase [Dethiobacter alkaliphilus]